MEDTYFTKRGNWSFENTSFHYRIKGKFLNNFFYSILFIFF